MDENSIVMSIRVKSPRFGSSQSGLLTTHNDYAKSPLKLQPPENILKGKGVLFYVEGQHWPFNGYYDGSKWIGTSTDTTKYDPRWKVIGWVPVPNVNGVVRE